MVRDGLLWGCLAAYSGSDATASRAIDYVASEPSASDVIELADALRWGFDVCDEIHAQDAGRPLEYGVDAADRAVDADVRLLELETMERRCVIGRCLGLADEEIERVLPLDHRHQTQLLLDRGVRKLAIRGISDANQVRELVSRVPPVPPRPPLWLYGASLIIAIAAIGTLVLVDVEPTASDEDAQLETIDLDKYREPDREVEVVVSPSGTIVRLEPETQSVIWESRPFTDPQLVSVDANTIAITSAGNRVILALTDGTQLPP